MRKSLEQERDEFVAEFEAIEDQLAHACAQLGRLMHSYRLDVGGLADAQSLALASTKALRAVAAGITPGQARPVKATRPQDSPSSLADQLADHRVAIVQTLALVERMPGSPALGPLTETVATQLVVAEGIARNRQPGKARG